MIIYCPSITLMATGYRAVITEIDARETEKYFIFRGHAGERRLKKTELLEPESILRPNILRLSWRIYCRAEDRQKAIGILKDRVIKEVAKLRAEYEAMIEHSKELYMNTHWPIIPNTPDIPPPPGIKL